MLLPRFDYEAPSSIGAAAGYLAAAKGEASVLAGGTDLLVKMKRGALRPRLVVSLRRVPGLSGVTTTESGGVRIGALTTMADISESDALRGAHTALREGATAVAGPIIRNRATVGGNIVNARPCADTVPALIALGARLQLQGANGCRVVPVDGFISGPGRTAIGQDEILAAIDLPPSSAARRGCCYLKITRRAAMEVTIVGCAACVDLDEDGRAITAARLVLASVAPAPVRAVEAEQALEGRVADAESVRGAAALARLAARPIDDCRAPADFRLEMVEVLARRALERAVDRARGSAS